MSIRIHDNGWREILSAKSSDDHSRLRIICPFIKNKALDNLLKNSQANDILVITRFSLADFQSGVSDLDTLEKLVSAGAKIRGVKNLHAKVYIFGERRAIVTSANLTWSALTRNSEYGVELTDEDNVQSCILYFDSLWKKSGSNLTLKMIRSWRDELELAGAKQDNAAARLLPDHGVDIGLVLSTEEVNARFLSATKHYIKFFATSGDREPRSTTIIDFLRGSGAHNACTYPKNRRPRRIKTGSTMYIAALVDDPRDIMIVGRAMAKAYEDGKDDATREDLRQRSWKGKWPHYIRVNDAEFVDGTLSNGVSLNNLMDSWKSDLFELTKRNVIAGSGNTDPRRAYLQRPDVELSIKGASWVRQSLETAFASNGKLDAEEYAHIK